jgi:hypothetical protein
MAGLAMGVMVGYYSLRILGCDDDSMLGHYKLRIKNSIIAGIILVVFSGILFFVGSKFFGISVSDLFFLK